MNIKNNKRYKSCSEKIETAFLSLILNNSYQNITISEICKKANINRSTFYAHYDDINDLIIKIESKFANGMSLIFDFGSRRNNDAFIELFKFVEQNKYFYKAFLSIPYPTFAEKKVQEQILSNIKNNLKMDNIDNIELTYRANFFSAGLKELSRLWLERDCKETPEQMAKILAQEYTNKAVE